MADKEIDDLTAAGTLDGTELVHVVQSGNSRQTNTQEIANLFVAELAVHDRGTITTGTETPEWTDGEMQKAVNNGAHTLAAMTAIGYYILTYTNGSSAGTITATGWDSVNDVDAVLEHVVENSIIECSAYNDGVSKRLIVSLIEDAT